MAKTLSITTASVSVGWSFLKDDLVGGTTNNGNTLTWKLSTPLTNGSGDGQASVLYVATRTLAGAATEDLDLSGSTLLDPFGDAVAFTKIKGLFITLNSSSTASSISVGNATANAWATPFGAANDLVKISNGYAFALLGKDAAGYAVTAGTGDLLKVLNNDATNTASYTILAYGA